MWRNLQNRKHREKIEHYVGMLHSVRTKLIFVMIFLMGLALTSFWIMNNLLFVPFYENGKVKLLEDSYQMIDEIVQNDADFDQENRILSSQSRLQFEILNQTRSINLYIFDVSNIFGQLGYTFLYSSVSEVEEQTIQDLTKNYLYEVEEEYGNTRKMTRGKNHKLIRQENEYNVFKAYDPRIGSDYLELFGGLTSGSYVYLRINYQSMSNNVLIFNRFVLYAGAAVVLVGIILMVVIGNGFTRPIMQITDIAKKMSELDFNIKYSGNSKDEVGVLGSSINVLSETLEKTISELKSANNELQKDIEKKTQIDEMRKEFLSNVSHELKTPIALIQGYAEGLQDNINEDKESRDFYCEVIIDEAKKMNKMVQKLLTLNQIEFGNNQIAFEHFDLVSLIKNVMNSAKLLADQKGAQMYLHEDYEPVYVWADEYMVEEVVTNYISNAINHVDGEKKIEVFVEPKGEIVKVRVRNTGKRIPEEELEKIWIKFYKVDKARTREYGGSGIGLSIVKAIMNAMNHECGVTNVEDGVEFWFELDCKN